MARSTERVRARAEDTGNRIVEAAFTLLGEVGTDFTVTDVTERAGSSRRAFYQYFDGKDELLLAIFEEVMAQSLALSRVAVEEAGDDPIDRLRAFLLTQWFELLKSETMRPGGTVSTRALATYHLRLAETKPAELVRAYAPILEALRQLVSAARVVGAIRTDLPDSKCAAYLLHTTVCLLQAHVFGINYAGELTGEAEELTGEEVWSLVANGMVDDVRVANPPQSSISGA